MTYDVNGIVTKNKLGRGCSGIAVIKDDKILIGLRSDGQGWCIAGGKQEAWETNEECAYRELREEFGLIAKELQYIGTVKSVVKEKGQVISVEPSIYVCRNFYGDLVISRREFLEYHWCNLDRVLEVENLFPPSKEAIKLLLAYFKEVNNS
ncbi:NUDIX domain-containing protein [Alkaliphilus transvaalensis]|uniref:NUDIX domain-containing protein n=1 Tax=Alkaliphilus transvaalensis TaxID=114628 RepID=UPI00047E1870|nr:NUDIX domain-containing protein [Alkaliphilus transvaalensis]